MKGQTTRPTLLYKIVFYGRKSVRLSLVKTSHFARRLFLLLLPITLGGCALGTICAFWISPTLPQTRGRVVLPGPLEQLEIIRDRAGIAHIAAANERDAAFGVGFVHAQDRLFQMDIMRRFIKGQISELVGNQKIDSSVNHVSDTLTSDRLMRTESLFYLAEIQYELLDATSRALLQAYADGVNAYLTKKGHDLPLEFQLLDYQPERWQPADSIAIARYYSFALTMNWFLEFGRAVIGGVVGEERMWQLLPRQKPEAPYIVSPEIRDYAKLARAAGEKKRPIEQTPFLFPTAAGSPNPSTGTVMPAAVTETSLPGLAAVLAALFTNRAHPRPEASNNWVVSGKLTRSGKPIVANDTHLPHLSPGIYYPVAYSYPGYDIFGFGFPGFPLVMVGNSRRIAWGVTTNMADTADLFVETVDPDNPNRYLSDGQSLPFGKRTEKLCYKENDKQVCENIVIRHTHHGPIISDVYPDRKLPPLALHWSGYYFLPEENEIYWAVPGLSPEKIAKRIGKKSKEAVNDLMALRQMARSHSVDEFSRAVRRIGAPIMNWVVADTEGNIGFFAPGLLPIRKKGDGTLPAPGESGEYDWGGFVPFDELPHVVNPKSGFIASANNWIVPLDYPYHWSYSFCTPYRAARITELLTEGRDFTTNDMQAIQLDVLSKKGVWLKPLLLDTWEDHRGENRAVDRAMTYLYDWDYRLDPDSIGGTLVNETWRRILLIALEDEFEDPELLSFYKSLPWVIFLYDQMLHFDTPLFDDRHTTQTETRADVVWQALVESVDYLSERMGSDPEDWRYGDLLTVAFHHMAGGRWPLDSMLNRGPLPHQGGFDTVRSALYYPEGERLYETFVGPANRHIVDMSHPETSEMVNDNGVSGVYGSPHYDDLMQMWHAGEYHQMQLDINEVKKISNEQLIILPGRK
jgi:penicillin G amidase